MDIERGPADPEDFEALKAWTEASLTAGWRLDGERPEEWVARLKGTRHRKAARAALSRPDPRRLPALIAGLSHEALKVVIEVTKLLIAAPERPVFLLRALVSTFERGGEPARLSKEALEAEEEGLAAVEAELCAALASPDSEQRVDAAELLRFCQPLAPETREVLLAQLDDEDIGDLAVLQLVLDVKRWEPEMTIEEDLVLLDIEDVARIICNLHRLPGALQARLFESLYNPDSESSWGFRWRHHLELPSDARVVAQALRGIVGDLSPWNARQLGEALLSSPALAPLRERLAPQSPAAAAASAALDAWLAAPPERGAELLARLPLAEFDEAWTWLRGVMGQPAWDGAEAWWGLLHEAEVFEALGVEDPAALPEAARGPLAAALLLHRRGAHAAPPTDPDWDDGDLQPEVVEALAKRLLKG